MYSCKKCWCEFALPLSCYKRGILDILHSVAVENRWIPHDEKTQRAFGGSQCLTPNAGVPDDRMGATESPSNTSSSAEPQGGDLISALHFQSKSISRATHLKDTHRKTFNSGLENKKKRSFLKCGPV